MNRVAIHILVIALVCTLSSCTSMNPSNSIRSISTSKNISAIKIDNKLFIIIETGNVKMWNESQKLVPISDYLRSGLLNAFKMQNIETSAYIITGIETSVGQISDLVLKSGAEYVLYCKLEEATVYQANLMITGTFSLTIADSRNENTFWRAMIEFDSSFASISGTANPKAVDVLIGQIIISMKEDKLI
jgi:hypothetical protein